MPDPQTPDRPVLVLLNSGAGSADDDRVDEVCRVLASHASAGVDVQRPDDEEYARVVATASGRDVVVVGGDGSIHRLLQELHDQELLADVGAIGVVPLGTGNDLARDAALPLEEIEAARVAVLGVPSPRGLLVGDDGVVVVNAVHAGVAAEATVHAGDVKGRLGKAAYVVGALRAGLTSRAWHIKVEVDGEVISEGERAVLMVTVALGSSVGGGTPVAPDARPDDGVVDVLVAHGTSPAARVGYALDLRKGRHTDREDVSTARGREVRIEAMTDQDAFRVNTDGDVAPDRVRARSWRLPDQGWVLRVPEAGGSR